MILTLLLIALATYGTAETEINYASPSNGATCTATTTQNNYPCENALDGDIMTSWIAEDLTPDQSVTVTIPLYIYVTKVQVLQHINTSPHYAKTITYYFNPGGEIIEIDGMTGDLETGLKIYTTVKSDVMIPTTSVIIECERYYTAQSYACRYYSIIINGKVNYALTERGATCTASNTVTGHECAKALDASTTTYFETVTGPVGEWIEVTLSTTTIVKGISVVQDDDTTDYHVKATDVSVNGATAISLDGGIGKALDNNKIRNIMRLQSTIAADTVRLTVASVSNPAPQAVARLDEVELYVPGPMSQACVAIAFDVSASISEASHKTQLANLIQAVYGEVVKERRLDIAQLDLFVIPFNEGQITAELYEASTSDYDSTTLFLATVTPDMEAITTALKTRATTDFSDLATTLDYLRDEFTCKGDVKFAVIVSDFYINQNVDDLEAAIQGVKDAEITLVSVVLDKKRSKTTYLKVKQAHGLGVDMSENWNVNLETVISSIYNDGHIQFIPDSYP